MAVVCLSFASCAEDTTAEATRGDDGSTSAEPTTSGSTTTTGATSSGSEDGESDHGTGSTGVPTTTGLPTSGSTSSGGPVPFELSSTAFAEGEMIPLEYECGAPAPVAGPGDNLTPPLQWTPGPDGTQSYAIVMHDVDATTLDYPEGIIHWVIYDIPAGVQALPEGIPAGYEVTDPRGAKQTDMQGSGFFGYFGPCSPTSVNTYVLSVHAMDTASVPGVTMDSTELEVAEIIESTSLASASLSGES